MVQKASKADKKIAYDQKLCQLLDNYSQILVTPPDNVGSNQLHNIRHGLPVAPVDVVVPPGNTVLDPSQTSFFLVLNISTKINKGTVEIFTPVELIKKGDKVGSSEAALLAKLGISPF